MANIVTSQREGTKLVDIHYDSYDQQGDNVDISVVVKVDGTPIPADNFHGDIGLNLRPGTGKHIIWDADLDGLPDRWEQGLVDADPHDSILSLTDVWPGDDFDGDLENWNLLVSPASGAVEPPAGKNWMETASATNTAFFILKARPKGE